MNNEDRVQEYLDEEYGSAEYNVLGCEESASEDEKVGCEVKELDSDSRFRVVVEFDGDEVRRIQGLPGRGR